MKIEVLLSTMDQDDLSIVDKMNITSNVTVINQCNKNEYIEKQCGNRQLKMFSFNERGVGISRNSALMRATGDICLMADDDMLYYNNYEEIVINAFNETPQADIIMFNVPIIKNNGEIKVKINKNERIRFFNALKFGTVNIAFKREKIFNKNIFFSLLFGGGAKFGSGEDSLFIAECLKKGLKIYSKTDRIAEVREGTSSWFKGYNEKFFYDRGALFAALSKNFSYFLAMQFAIRKRNLYKGNTTTKQALKYMISGIQDYNNVSY